MNTAEISRSDYIAALVAAAPAFSPEQQDVLTTRFRLHETPVRG